MCLLFGENHFESRSGTLVLLVVNLADAKT